MELAAQGRGLVIQIDAAAKHMHSITELKRLGAHMEVKDIWQKAELIMSRVDWQAQNDTLADITRLTRKYTALEFKDFCSSIPKLVDYVLKAKQHAKAAAKSLGAAAMQLAELSLEVNGILLQLEAEADQHKCWKEYDAEESLESPKAGKLALVLGPMTLGLGLNRRVAANKAERHSEDHAQSLSLIQDVQGVLKGKVGPVFLAASGAMSATAQFFDTMLALLHEIAMLRQEGAEEDPSVLHAHYPEMREIMRMLRFSVQTLSACLSCEARHIS